MQTVIKMKDSGISNVIEKKAIDEMREMRDNLRTDWRADRKNPELKAAYKFAQEELRKNLGKRKSALDSLHETSVDYMKGLWFKTDEAQEVERMLARVTPEFSLPAWVSNTSRTLMTTMDVGGAMIQGIVGLVVEPQAFIPAYVKSIQTLFRPEVYEKYMSSPKALRVLQQMPELHLGGGRNTEQFARCHRLQPHGSGPAETPRPHALPGHLRGVRRHPARGMGRCAPARGPEEGAAGGARDDELHQPCDRRGVHGGDGDLPRAARPGVHAHLCAALHAVGARPDRGCLRRRRGDRAVGAGSRAAHVGRGHGVHPHRAGSGPGGGLRSERRALFDRADRGRAGWTG